MPPMPEDKATASAVPFCGAHKELLNGDGCRAFLSIPGLDGRKAPSQLGFKLFLNLISFRTNLGILALQGAFEEHEARDGCVS